MSDRFKVIGGAADGTDVPVWQNFYEFAIPTPVSPKLVQMNSPLSFAEPRRVMYRSVQVWKGARGYRFYIPHEQSDVFARHHADEMAARDELPRWDEDCANAGKYGVGQAIKLLEKLAKETIDNKARNEALGAIAHMEAAHNAFFVQAQRQKGHA